MRVDRCKRCGANDLMHPEMFMCQSCRADYRIIKEKLNKEECVVLDELLDKHFNSDSCECDYNDEDNIRMCPIEEYENGYNEESLIKKIKDILKQKNNL